MKPDTRSHARAKDKTGFSIALNNTLLARIARIAKDETRSRNGQIARMLEACVADYDAKHGAINPAAVEAQEVVLRSSKRSRA